MIYARVLCTLNSLSVASSCATRTAEEGEEARIGSSRRLNLCVSLKREGRKLIGLDHQRGMSRKLQIFNHWCRNGPTGEQREPCDLVSYHYANIAADEIVLERRVPRDTRHKLQKERVEDHWECSTFRLCSAAFALDPLLQSVDYVRPRTHASKGMVISPPRYSFACKSFEILFLERSFSSLSPTTRYEN